MPETTEAILRALHTEREPKTYFETGVGEGHFWRLVAASSQSVGIDTQPDIALAPPGSAQLFQGTPAEFFDQHKLANLWQGAGLDMALLDAHGSIARWWPTLVALAPYCGPQTLWVLRHPKTAASDAAHPSLLRHLAQACPHWQIQTFTSATEDVTVITGLRAQDPAVSQAYGLWVQGEQPPRAKAPPHAVRMPRHTKTLAKPRMLGVLMCYNDADILADAIEHLLVNDHDLLIWDHGSNDATPAVIEKYKKYVVEHRWIGRDVDFYGLYQALSQVLIDQWVAHYDWISWPDQDELLEGPDRSMGYANHVAQVLAQGYDWVVFNNYNYWWTQEDIGAIASPTRRVRHYGLFADCSPRIRAWRASCTNIRAFNHNPLQGKRYPLNFNLRHYPMRTQAQMQQRLDKDRASLQRGTMNYHYNNMARQPDRLIIPAHKLHFDDGLAELCAQQLFDWRTIYGHPPA